MALSRISREKWTRSSEMRTWTNVPRHQNSATSFLGSTIYDEEMGTAVGLHGPDGPSHMGKLAAGGGADRNGWAASRRLENNKPLGVENIFLRLIYETER